jgi:hypothetical protein
MDLLGTNTNTFVNMRDITDKKEEEEVIVEMISLHHNKIKQMYSKVKWAM